MLAPYLGITETIETVETKRVVLLNETGRCLCFTETGWNEYSFLSITEPSRDQGSQYSISIAELNNSWIVQFNSMIILKLIIQFVIFELKQFAINLRLVFY